MIPKLRQAYNAAFTEDTYIHFVDSIQKRCDHKIDFRISETPLFIPAYLKDKLIAACHEMLNVIKSSNFKELTKASIPEKYSVKNENDHPHFICIDFGICEGNNGELEPQLIELQGFASMFCWMDVLGNTYREHFKIPEGYSHFLSGLNHDSYIELLRKTIIGKEDPKHVILMELNPKEQKTRVDFYLTQEFLGIDMVCLSDLVQEGNKLFYIKDGERVQVKRIYNRLIFDDLEANPDFTYSINLFEDLDVEWIAHPNWFYRISKYTMPFFEHAFVPKTQFVNTLKEIPSNLEDYVLKPLFSFSGMGVVIDVTKADILQIKDPENWILQEKVSYAEAVETPEGGVKCEIRMMYLWPDGDENPTLAISLSRMSRGKMIGVRYNKDLTWVGSTVSFFEQ